jgi:hypothetical protein
MAEEVAKDCPIVLRKRKFTTVSLAQTFVLGFLFKPRANDEELAQTAALCGVEVTPQAIAQRFTKSLANFLEALFRRAIQHVVKSRKSLAPLLDRFAAVLILDSTTIRLPDVLKDRFPGCGGSHGSGQSAVKLQVQWDLRSGALNAVAIEPGRDCDYKTSLQSAPLTAGSLRIADLGYFDTAVFDRFNQEEVFWLSRLQFGTSVFSRDGVQIPLLGWLGEQAGPDVDQSIWLGTERQVACRLIAWRVPQEMANRRRQKLIAEARRKSGRVPTKERLAWCDWTILVTNVAPDVLTPEEIAVLYSVRWQIELMFKRWKSQGLVAELTGSTVARQMVCLWARLLAVLVEHWLVLAGTWGNPRCSLVKAGRAIRQHAKLLTAAIGDLATMTAALESLGVVLRATARQNKRKKPSSFELLNDPERLGYFLT